LLETVGILLGTVRDDHMSEGRGKGVHGRSNPLVGKHMQTSKNRSNESEVQQISPAELYALPAPNMLCIQTVHLLINSMLSKSSPGPIAVAKIPS